MPSAVAPNPRARSVDLDELDALFNEPANNYDREVDDFRRDMNIGGEDNAISNTTNAEKNDDDPDAEIKVRKQRKPNPKLDEALLTSDKGIQKLRRTARAKLKFKGKGHEFSDMSRLLTMYQLWLDDMYPKAKFRDGLTMVEKLGHSKRMQVMRRAWIDETKPIAREDSPERLGDDVQVDGGAQDTQNHDASVGRQGASQADASVTRNQDLPPENHTPEDDELDALMAEQHDPPAKNQPARRGPFEDDDEDDMDDLDALMAENEQQAHEKPDDLVQKPRPSIQDDGPDENELDALMTEQSREPAKNKSAPQSMRMDNDFEDDEEAMAGMW